MEPLGQSLGLDCGEYADDMHLRNLVLGRLWKSWSAIWRSMRISKLRLNWEKTHALLVRNSLTQIESSATLNEVVLHLQAQVCSLGVLLDLQLSLESQEAVVVR